MCPGPKSATTASRGTTQTASQIAAVRSVPARSVFERFGSDAGPAGSRRDQLQPSAPAASTTSGYGTEKSPSKRNDPAATRSCRRSVSARLPMRSIASTTSTSTVAWMPANAAATHGTWPNVA